MPVGLTGRAKAKEAGRCSWQNSNRRQQLDAVHGRRATGGSSWTLFMAEEQQEAAAGRCSWQKSNRRQQLDAVHGRQLDAVHG